MGNREGFGKHMRRGKVGESYRADFILGLVIMKWCGASYHDFEGNCGKKHHVLCKKVSKERSVYHCKCL